MKITVPQARVVLIIGGVGPMAGVILHKKIIEHTKTDGTDQSHLDVYHISRSSVIPDRTKYLTGEITDSPALAAAEIVSSVIPTFRKLGQTVVVGVPCNTFHVPRIWNEFANLIKKHQSIITPIHMLQETGTYLMKQVPHAKKIGLMSTTGTRNSRVYNNILESMGFKIVEVPETIQHELHEAIYNTTWGIKAVSPTTKKAKEGFERFAKLLINQGAEAIILGCTEIPLALPDKAFQGVPLIDPMDALALKLVTECSK